jgi:hypothetical protein
MFDCNRKISFSNCAGCFALFVCADLGNFRYDSKAGFVFSSDLIYLFVSIWPPPIFSARAGVLRPDFLLRCDFSSPLFGFVPPPPPLDSDNPVSLLDVLHSSILPVAD